MAPPHQKSNGRRSMFTNKTPHFFKIILQKTLRDGKLEIPKMFIRKYGNGMSSPALLKVPSGDVWKVGLRKRDGKVWLKNGWPEFSNHYSLDQGHFLVFRYQGNCNFHVIIMDKTATEIDYPYTNNYHEQHLEGIPDESEDDDDVAEIIDEIPPRTQRLKAGEKRVALERAAGSFKSENPFFMLIMQPSYVGLTPRCRLDLPLDFVRKHLMKGDCEITLCNSDGKTWPVKLYQGQSRKGVYAILHVGWETFVQDNNLQFGDVYAFELINCNDITLKVVKCQVKDGDRRKTGNLGSSCGAASRGKRVEIECEESLEIDDESNLQKQHLTEEFPVPMKEGEILDDFWVAEKIEEDRPKSASRP